MSGLRRTARPLFVGTAGWSIPKIQADRFQTEGSHLERYSEVFRAAEINSSFYRPHRRSTYERWSGSVKRPFKFAVKAPQSVTHADWRNLAADLDAFFAETAGLGDTRGPILVQLPPKRVFEKAEARSFLAAFRDRTEGAVVLEPRHESWFAPAAGELLQAQEIARVAADPPRTAGADRPGGWPGLAYFRLHGSPVIYRSSYSEERLDHLASSIGMTLDAGVETWCIFDNTTAYAAVDNALTLVGLLEAKSVAADSPSVAER